MSDFHSFRYSCETTLAALLPAPLSDEQLSNVITNWKNNLYVIFDLQMMLTLISINFSKNFSVKLCPKVMQADSR